MKLAHLREALAREHAASLIDVTYDAMAVSDTAVAKSLMISDVARIARIEVRIREYLLAKWNVRANQAAARAAELMVQHGQLPTSETSAMHAIDVIMAKFPGDVEARIKLEIETIYKLARKAGAKKARGETKASLYYTLIGIDKPVRVRKAKSKKGDSFTLLDAQAVAELQADALNWIGQHYDKNLRKTLRTIIASTLTQGLGRVASGEVLREALKTVNVPNGFSGTAAQYFEGLAANIATNARVRGQLRSFDGIGVAVYEIVNPMDERTCEVCGLMNGKKFKVSDGVAQMERTQNAKTPQQAKRAHPWLSKVKIKQIYDEDGVDGLVKAGQALPPYHFYCRCTIDVSFESFDFNSLDDDDDD